MSSTAPHAGVNASLDRELQQRFARAWRLLKLPQARATVVVACSGGADSAAALALLRQTAPRLRIIACYVNHKLRPVAAIRRDVAAVRHQARYAHAEVCVRTLPAKLQGGSVEELARNARYALLAQVARDHGAAFVVTGHHADDVAETVILALMRGSGLDGAAAMPAKRPLAPSVTLARPLLFADRDQLRTFVSPLGLPVSEDETNDDVRLRRNAVRVLLAGLERVLPGARRNIMRSGKLLRGDKALIAGYVIEAWRRCKQEGNRSGLSMRALRELPINLLRHVIRYAVKQRCGNVRNFSLRQCSAIVDALKAGRGGEYQAGAARVHISAGSFQIAASRSHAVSAFHGDMPAVTLSLDERAPIETPYGTLTFQRAPAGGRHKPMSADARSVLLDRALLKRGALHVRLPRPGDKCIPSGRRSLTSLARFLAKAGVPKTLRATVPLLCAENRIAAALGVRAMEPFAAKNGAPALQVSWQPLHNCR